MQTKYPKKQKTKIISNNANKNQMELNDVLTEQNYQIEELKQKTKKSEYNNAYLDARSEYYEEAYQKTLTLEENLGITNRHAVNAHVRLDAIDLQLQTIVANGETNTTDLSNLTETVSSNTNRIRTNELDISDLKQTTDQQDQDIENINTQVTENATRITALEQNAGSTNTDELESQISDLSNQVQSNTSRIDVLEQNVINIDFEDLQQSMTTLANQVEQNTEIIQDWQTTTENLRSVCNNVEAEHQNLLEQNQNLQTSINTNATNIQNLQNQVDINTAKIEILQNSGTSGGNSELDLVDLTQQVEQNSADIVSLQTQQDINTADIASLLAFKEKFTTPTDEHYCPKTYSDYPAGTIIQTYACYERDLSIYGSSSITTPYVYFLAEPESAGTIKLQFDLSTEAETGTIAIETYVNKTEVDKIYLDIVAGHNIINHTVYETTLNTEGKSNEIYCKIAYSSSVKATLHYFKAELLAPNADLIQYNRPINVEYIDGKYYVSDCTSGTVKLATINVDDMYNMDNLQFEDLGIEAQSFNVGMSTTYVVDHYEPLQLAYVYATKNNKFMFYSVEHDKTTTANTNYVGFDFLIYGGNNIRFSTTNRITGKTAYCFVYGSNGGVGYGNLGSGLTNSIITNSCKILLPCEQFESVTSYATLTTNGEVILNNQNSSSNNFSLGYGTHVRVFLTQMRSSIDYDLKVYVKKYEKLVEYDITYNSTSGTTINKITDIGTYDDIFIGPKNDYFAVKGGVLSYHFFPTEQTTENTESTTTE
ncbi:MAG: hypothetical protein ACI4TT_01495 [Christensenellales bacterium]